MGAPVPGPALEDVQTAFNAGFESVTALIPSRWDFIGGETGNNILGSDDADMYDGGNFLSTDLEANFGYTTSVIT